MLMYAHSNIYKQNNLNFSFQCVLFHPNSNYIATGSSDRTVRLWDCISGNYVRLMTGHKAPIYTLAFAMCGRFLASGSADNRVLIWDLAHGHLIAQFCGHTETVHSLCFSRDGTVLATGVYFSIFFFCL